MEPFDAAQTDHTAGELRRLAGRRRALRRRAHRVIPGIVVGSVTLVGTGVLTAWVGQQPGLAASTAAATAAAPIPPTPTRPVVDPALSSLSAQLRAENAELEQLTAALVGLTNRPPPAALVAVPNPSAAGAAVGTVGAVPRPQSVGSPYSASPAPRTPAATPTPTAARTPIAAQAPPVAQAPAVAKAPVYTAPAAAPAAHATTGASHAVP